MLMLFSVNSLLFFLPTIIVTFYFSLGKSFWVLVSLHKTTVFKIMKIQ